MVMFMMQNILLYILKGYTTRLAHHNEIKTAYLCA